MFQYPRLNYVCARVREIRRIVCPENHFHVQLCGGGQDLRKMMSAGGPKEAGRFTTGVLYREIASAYLIFNLLLSLAVKIEMVERMIGNLMPIACNHRHNFGRLIYFFANKEERCL